MRCIKLPAFCFILAILVISDPLHVPAQPGGGKGGSMPRLDSKVGNNGEGRKGPDGGSKGPGGGMDPERIWSMLQQQTGSTGDSIDLSKLPAQTRMFSKMMAERSGAEPLPESGIMSKADFLSLAARNEAARAAKMANGGGPGMGAGPGSMGGGSSDEQAARRIKEQDKDGDGRISYEEADGRLRPNFRGMDKNGDGFIDLEEYKAALSGGGNNWGGGGNNWGGDRDRDRLDLNSGNRERQEKKENIEESKPIAVRYGHLPKDLPEWYDTFDTNKDGQVALHEWRKAAKSIEEFNTYDLNGDGLVTSDEIIRGGILKNESEKIAILNGEGGVGTGKPSRNGGGSGFTMPGATPPDKVTASATNDKPYEKPTDKSSDKMGKGSEKGSGGNNPFQNGGKSDWPKGDFGKKGKN